MLARTRTAAVIVITAALAAMPAATGLVAADDTIRITAVDLAFEPATVEVPGPGRFSFVLDDAGALAHDLTFPDGTTAHAEPGASSPVVQVDVPADGLEFWCSIPNHREAGMEGRIAVAGSAVVSAAGLDGSLPAVPGVDPDPDAPSPRRVDPEVPPLGDPGEVDVDLVIESTQLSVAPGYQVLATTFGGSVPGPVIHARVGDSIRVQLTNEDSVAHSVDFHANPLATDDQPMLLEPGDRTEYLFTATAAGVWMYQGSTAPAFGDVVDGLFGMLIVEPRGGLPPAGEALAFVQNEWYIDGQGLPPSLAGASAGAPAPDFVAFNGVAGQYRDDPIVVRPGRRLRLFVLDAGPSLATSFRVEGALLDRVIKEGVELAPGNPGGYHAGAVDLAPGQGAIIDTTLGEIGTYPFLSQAFNQAARGAYGVLEAHG